MDKSSELRVLGLNHNFLKGDLSSLPPARIVDESVGVVGPPGCACAQLTRIEEYRGEALIVWAGNDEQVINTKQTILEFFIASEIDYKKIAFAWSELMGPIGTRTSVPPGSFVLMTGFPGSGKTTLARSLSAELGMLHFDFSSFARRIVGRHPLCQEDYLRIGRQVEPLIAGYLTRGGTMIYDTTAIDSSIREHHFNAIPEFSSRTLVWVPTESNLCHQRLTSQRPCESPDLRPNLMRISVTHVRTFHDFVIGFEPPRSAIVVPNGFEERDASLRIVESLRSPA